MRHQAGQVIKVPLADHLRALNLDLEILDMVIAPLFATVQRFYIMCRCPT